MRECVGKVFSLWGTSQYVTTGKVLLIVRHSTVSVTIHVSPPCPIPRALMKNLKRYWVPWTLSRLFSIFHYKITFQALSDLLSPSCARVWLVKNAPSPPAVFRASEELGCYHANWCLLGSLVRALSLVPSRAHWRIRCFCCSGLVSTATALSAPAPGLSLVCAVLAFSKFFRCWIAGSVAFGLFAVSVVKVRQEKPFPSPPRECPEATVLMENLANGVIYIHISFIALTFKNRRPAHIT